MLDQADIEKRSLSKDSPKVSPEELERICSLKVEPEEMTFMDILAIDYPDKVRDLAKALMRRDFYDELPVEEETFALRRNTEECRKLRSSAAKLTREEGELADREDLDNLSKLLAFESRKADWLDQNYYPALFGEAVELAKSELLQFLLKQSNLRGIDTLPYFRSVKLELIDDLNYIKAGYDPKNIGFFNNEDKVTLRMLPDLKDGDQWEIYLTAVHELIHYATNFDEYREVDRGSGDLTELMEAITEILTFKIAQDHIDKGKTYIKGQDRKDFIENQSLQNMDMDSAYGKYTVVVRNIFSKVPPEVFMDALFQRQGWSQLKDVFSGTFGSEDALIEFGRNLKTLYTPAEKRVNRKNLSRV